ncbi:MAG: nitrilase-related carbon-nitrogen hydrolase [Anaerolineaceae bacterium]
MEIKISIAQLNVIKNSYQVNLDKLLYLIDQLQIHKSHILLLPELWSTGFTSKLKNANGFNLEAIDILSTRAKERNIAICGSYILKNETNQFVNRLVVTTPSAKIFAAYDKNKLFGQMREKEWFSPGRSLKIAKIFDHLFGLTICYDLRFPEIYRNYAKFKPQFFLVPSQWPSIRINHFKKLLSARSIENQAIFISANSVGKTGNINFGGNSIVTDYMGEIILDMQDKVDEIGSVIVNTDPLERWRKDFPVLDDLNMTEKVNIEIITNNT